ncbi:hypothetical protein K1719_008784 [Acacia pycnantha]|nr:hypothetical protein K1719_008784 [Acacia pycnantha]
MRLFDPDIAVLDALKSTNISLTLGIRNEDLPAMAAAMEPVNTWFKTYVEPYLNDIVFEHIVAGNELVPGDLANYILPVMQNFQTLLDAQNLKGISMTTCVATTVLGNSFPPSQSIFSDQSKECYDIVVQDGSFGYSNLLDAMIDSFYWAMENAGFADVEVVVSRVVGLLRW